ncbi:MAG: DNA-processing protein DprA [Jatrophihabitantaceae bacterium]
MGGVTEPVSDEVLLARAYLSRVSDPGSVPVWGYVRSVGPVAAARAIAHGHVPDEVRRATASRRDDADPYADLEAAERHGIRLVTPETDEWPHFAFAALERTGIDRLKRYQAGDRKRAEAGEPMPPLALWVRGTAELASVGVRSVGMVGSRSATRYGERISAELSYGLAQREVVVVSGGAYGIDAAAHRGALAADGPTVLVSAGGLDRPYPPGNTNLFERVAESGLLVSESPAGCAPQRHRFLSRNRLIAALGTGTVVVEAGQRSGAANTAKHCRTLQRPLMAVPGPVDSAMSIGCHNLIRAESNPAILVTCLDDVLAVVGGSSDVPQISAGQLPSTDGLREVLDRLDPSARRVFDGLFARRFARPDEIAVRSGTSALEVIRALPTLDLARLIETGDAGYRIAARLRKA